MPHLDPPTNEQNIIQLNIEEITTILKSLLIGKACDPDCINNRILKAIAETITHPLMKLFNSSLISSTVPDIWKKRLALV